MADNILKGTIKIDAPGVKETFDNVSQGVANLQKNLGSVSSSAQQSSDGLKNAFTKVLDGIDTNVRPIPIKLDTTEAEIQAKLLEGTIETLEAKLGARKEFIRIIDPNDVTKLAVLNKEIQDLEKEITRLRSIGKAGFDEFGNKIDAFGNNLSNMTKKNSAATQSLVNLSRVAQDAPYGFIGISNNLNPLLESFQRLRAEAGSNKAALTSLISSLGGAGGLGLAVGIASSLLVVFSDKLFGTSKAEDKVGDSAKEARQRVQELLKSTSDIKAVAIAEPTAEISKVKALADAVLDQTKSYKERNNALTELKEINKNYFGDLTLESEKLKTLRDRVDEYTQAIIAQSVIKAFADEIGNVTKELTKQELAANKTKSAIDNYNKAKFKGGDAEHGGGVVPLTFDDKGNAVAGLGKINDLYLKQYKNVSDLKGQLNDLNGALKTAVEESLKFKPLTIPTGTSKKPKFEKVNFFEDFLDFDPKKVKADTENAAKAYDIFLKYALENQKTKLGLDDLLKIESKPAAIKAAAEWWEAYSKAWKENRPDEFVKYVPSLDIKPKISLDKKQIEQDLQQGLKELSKNKIDVNPTVRVNVNQGLIDDYESFKSIGERIGRSIGGGFDDAFKKIFDDTFQQALSKGLSGDALENFKSEFTVVSAVAAQGIQGIADAFASFTDAVLQGKNGMQAFGEAIKGIFKSIAVEIVRDIILAGILSALTGGSANGGLSFIGALGKVVGGSHATGLKRVPKDGYIAELHKDEMVVPARQAAALRSVMNPDFSIPSIGFQAPQNIKLPTFSTASFSNINNAANTLRSMSKQTLDISVGGEFVQRGGDLVAVVNRTQRQQNITF